MLTCHYPYIDIGGTLLVEMLPKSSGNFYWILIERAENPPSPKQQQALWFWILRLCVHPLFLLLYKYDALSSTV